MGVEVRSSMEVNVEKLVKFTFPDCLIKSPLIYEVAQIFQIITNIEKANVNELEGWVILKVKGNSYEMDKAFQWMADQGVTVQMMLPDI